MHQPPLCPVIDSIDQDTETSPAFDFLAVQSYLPEDLPQHARTELLKLKSPLVLYMMEQRMGKGLMQKIANKLMVAAMSGELPNGLGTKFFLRLVGKISGKLEIKEFAEQWIFGSGCPVLVVRYNFNRKKMIIELKVKQENTNQGMVDATPKFTV